MKKPPSGKRYEQITKFRLRKARKRKTPRQHSKISGLWKPPFIPFEVELDNGRESRIAIVENSPTQLCSELTFSRNAKQTALALNRVRRALNLPLAPRQGPVSKDRLPESSLPERIYSYIDLAGVGSIGPDSALILASYIHESLETTTPENLFAVNMKSWKPEVYKTLAQTGFMHFLGVHTDYVPQSSVRMDSYSSGDADTHLIIDAIKTICDGLLTRDIEFFIQSYLPEILDNLGEHAYFSLPRDAKPDWWFYAIIDKGELRIGVYDAGFSIQTTLGFKGKAATQIDQEIAGRQKISVQKEKPADLWIPKDGHLLAKALMEHASRHEGAERGNGLLNLNKSLDELPNTTLRVVSRSGMVERSSGQQAKIANLPAPLKGTLVSLTFKL